MSKKKEIAKGVLLGVLLLAVGLCLPGLVFAFQDGKHQKEVKSYPDRAIEIQLSEKNSLVPMSLNEKIQLAGSEYVQAVAILQESEFSEIDADIAIRDILMSLRSMQWDAELKKFLKEAELPFSQEEFVELLELSYEEIFVVDVYSVLLMDRQDFTRQYKAKEILIRVGSLTVGAWVDEETGAITALWENDRKWRMPTEMIQKYFGDT